MTDAGQRQRLDQWLVRARFFKTRAMAAAAIRAGHVRLNGVHVKKPARSLSVGDILTFHKARQIFTVRVLAAAERRGPATEAAKLFHDLSGD